MKFKYVFIASLILAILMVGAVSADDTVSQDIVSDDEDNTLETVDEEIYTETESTGTFTDLNNEIGNSTGELNIKCNYKFNNETDNPNLGIGIGKNNLVINGNGHTIDADNQSRIFFVRATNVTIKNLTLINANSATGSAITVFPGASLTTDSLIIENSTAKNGVVFVNGEYYSLNDRFKDVTSAAYGVITVQAGRLCVENALMSSSKELSWGFIQSIGESLNYSPITVLNSTFRDTISNYSTAIRASGNIIVRNSKFINLESLITAGAIGLKGIHELLVDNCTFVNVTSDKNGGAVYIDVMGSNYPNTGEVLINRSTFVNCSSGFGGAILQLGGFLNVANSNFTENLAIFDGGAIYTSYVGVNVVNSTFNANCAWYPGEQRGSFGGAIFCDKGMLIVKNSNLTRNLAQYGGAIYLYDSSYNVDEITFKENTGINGKYDDVCTVFDGNIAVLDNATNNYSGNDSISLNNTNYATIVNFEGMKLSLINNTIDISELPSRFDLREWGWVTSVKDQGTMGACWTFGASGALESAILRYLGLEVDLSENNMQDVSLKYYMYGVENMVEGGLSQVPAEYALSWLGVFDEEYDVYDQLGKISPIFAAFNSIHFQDVVIVPPRQNATDNNQLKEAILKYGGVFINYFACSGDIEQYYNGTPQINHGVTLIGWDDNRQIAGAPEKGAWIIKNSWGTGAGENGYQYISYYDTSLSTVSPSFAYLLENTVAYNMNYQYDILGSISVYSNATEYRNNYVAIKDDLIAGVGTYFLMGSGTEYTIEIYVNDELKLTQDGVAPFLGFHTVKLDSYVPINKGDVFTVKIKSDSVPVLKESRQHYVKGASQYLYDGVWMNISSENAVCSIKAYTVSDDSKVIQNADISVDYASLSSFSVKVVTADGHPVAGASVGFTINGKTVNVSTDVEGIAKLEINEAPGTYVITTVYNNQSYENNVTVTLDSKNCKVVCEDIAVDYAGGSYFTVKVVSGDGKVAVEGESVIFILNGDAITAKTDKNGIARIKITQTPGKYTIKTVFNGKTYNNKVTVKQVLKTSKVTVKKTAKKFTLKAKLKINGKLVKDKTVTFKFNGKTYKVKTNKKGIAKKTLKKNVIKKLKKGKTYTVKVTYLKDTIKTTVKVK
ncbi:C1 family peptidase [Methanobrevibacter sp.]|uniref:C1 family peptidase n=1 Tax=Methanobrevibacter sp. TaxID=66852 RepID=UPI00388FFE4E